MISSPQTFALLVFLSGFGAILSGLSLGAESGPPAFASDPASVESRMHNVERLIRTSSGARRVASSGNTLALRRQAEADQWLQRAEVAYAKGDMAGSKAALDEATAAMFAAIREIGTGQDGVDKQARDFDHKAESADVLLSAITRVAEEKGDRQAVSRRATAIAGRVAGARESAARGELELARRQLDVAYEEAKNELEGLREGETLVRTLSFANDEDEYHYEVDRNETHRMLIKVLLGERTPSATARQQIDRYVAEAGRLRAEAEGQAGAGEFRSAVTTLEESTRALQRAIRSAGIYIPG